MDDFEFPGVHLSALGHFSNRSASVAELVRVRTVTVAEFVRVRTVTVAEFVRVRTVTVAELVRVRTVKWQGPEVSRLQLPAPTQSKKALVWIQSTRLPSNRVGNAPRGVT